VEEPVVAAAAVSWSPWQTPAHRCGDLGMIARLIIVAIGVHDFDLDRRHDRRIITVTTRPPWFSWSFAPWALHQPGERLILGHFNLSSKAGFRMRMTDLTPKLTKHGIEARCVVLIPLLHRPTPNHNRRRGCN